MCEQYGITHSISDVWHLVSLCLRDLKGFVPHLELAARWGTNTYKYIQTQQHVCVCIPEQILSYSQLWAPEQIQLIPRTKICLHDWRVHKMLRGGEYYRDN